MPSVRKVECYSRRSGVRNIVISVAGDTLPRMSTTGTSPQQATSLPLVAVPGGVVFPGAVVTLTLDSDEARAAVETASAGERRVLLVPRRDSRYSTIGVIATVESVGELPVGGRAAILRSVQRARIGAAVASERGGLWVEVDPITDPRPTPRVEAADA